MTTVEPSREGTPSRTQLEQRYRRSRTLNLVLAVIAALSLATLALVWSGASTDQGAETAGPQAESGTATPEDAAPSSTCPIDDRRDPNDPMAVGAVDAPIVLHEWTDFRCPYCGLFSRDTLPTILTEYVDTGDVRIEFHDAALVGGENSIEIAAAARAAGTQERYLAYLMAVYERQEATDNAELSTEDMVTLGEAAGVPDLEQLRHDIEAGTHLAAVRDATSQAQQFGVSGVPFFATSSCAQVVSGAQPLDAFRDMLDESLAAHA